MSKTRPTTKRAIAVIRDARGARRAKADALATALTQVEGSEL